MHDVTIIDFAWNGTTLFIEFTGFDGERNARFKGMVRVVGDTPYGDIIHERRSELSPSCRAFVVETLMTKIQQHAFD